MNPTGSAKLITVDGTGLRFEARFASGRSVVADGGPGSTDASPVELLVAALATCQAMDVISLLRKKRQDVTAYEVLMAIERATTHPRRLTAVELTHRVTGKSIREDAVADAVRLSCERYCSVHHSLDPAMPITNRIEVIEG